MGRHVAKCPSCSGRIWFTTQVQGRSISCPACKQKLKLPIVEQELQAELINEPGEAGDMDWGDLDTRPVERQRQYETPIPRWIEHLATLVDAHDSSRPLAPRGGGVCQSCQGFGMTNSTCPSCYGSGIIGGFACGLCHGRRFAPCASCGGTGRS